MQVIDNSIKLLVDKKKPGLGRLIFEVQVQELKILNLVLTLKFQQNKSFQLKL